MTAPATLRRQLELLERSDLVRLWASAPELEYVFRHALIHEAAYASLLRGQRAQWHRATADALEHLYLAGLEPGPQLEQQLDRLAPVLAHHHVLAGNPVPALAFYARAGEVAYRRFANAEAAGYFDRAVALALRQPDHAPEQVRHLFSRLGRTQELSARPEAALQTYGAMLDLARERGDPRLALAAYMARATLHSTASYVFDEAAAQADLEQARGLAQTLGDRPAEAHLNWTLLLRNTMIGGDPDDRLHYGEAAVRLARDLGLREQLAYALLDIWYAHAGLGRWADSLVSVTEAAELWRALGNLSMLCEAHARAAITHMVAGQFAAGLASVAGAYQVSLEANSPHMQGLSRVFAGRMHLEQGRLAEAVTVMQDVIVLGENSGNVTALIGTRADLAHAYGLLGEPAIGLTLAHQAIEAGRGRFDLLLVPWPRAVAARLHLQQGDTLAAAEDLAGLDYRALRRGVGFMPFMWISVGLAAVELALERRNIARAVALAAQLLADTHASRITFLAPEVGHLYGRALLAGGRLAEAQRVLQAARAAALDLGARRQLWPILDTLAAVEAQTGAVEAAGRLRAEAAAVIEILAAHAPPAQRASFLAQASVRALRQSIREGPSP
jgi:tetratricopeptide (TPR) repeat protein